MKTYTTKQGDMWDAIAYSELGSERYTGALMEANPAHRDIFIFSSGTVLNIPDASASPVANELPPWRRVSG